MKTLIVGVAIMCAALVQVARADELRIGFVSTLSGGAAPLGIEMLRGWEIGLEHQGWRENGDKLGGVPTTVYVGDDKRRPDQGLTLVNQWIRQDRVQIVAGFVWSNVILAARQPVLRNRSILLSTNAGANPLGGQECSKYFISTSWRSAQNSEATGEIMNEQGVENVFALAPNYQAGKDYVDGVRRRFNGEFLGQALFDLGEQDFQAEIARIRDVNPKAIFVFAPGSMGIAFLRQWQASGLSDQVKMYGIYVVDWSNLEAHGDAAIGTYHTGSWSVEVDSDATRRFVRGFVAAHGRNPAFVAAQAYDAVNLIAAAVKAVDGNVNDTLGLMREMRKANFESVRGPFSFEPNGIPRQNWYLFRVERGSDGNPVIRTVETVFTDYPDGFLDNCPTEQQLKPE